MADEEMSRSLLEEYSIAELHGDLSIEQWGSLKDAFSRYAKVIFHDVADSYATDADILCCFTLSSDMQRKDGDLVALFRLGWRHSEEMVTSQLVPQPSNPESHDYEVLFKASDLPKNEGEIYQLCYISQNEVWGASVPFEFRRASAEELLVVESGDIAIVRSQPAVAEDLKRQLAEIRKEKLIAENNQVEIQEKLTKAEEQNKLLRRRLSDLENMEQTLDRLRSENQTLDKACNESKEALQNAELQIISLESTIAALQQDIVHLKNQLSAQVEAYERKDKAAQEQSSSQEMIDALRQGKDVAVREMRAAMADNERLQGELTKVTTEKENLFLQVDALNIRLRKSEQEREQCEVSLKKRIEELLAELTLLSSDSLGDHSNDDMECMKTQVMTLEAKLEIKEREVQSLLAQQNASSFSSAPKVKDEKEIAAIQKDLENVTTRCAEVTSQIESLLAETDTLKNTEISLRESHTRLKERVENLLMILTDATDYENDLETRLHRRELSVASAKLEEKWVCIISAQSRQEELNYEIVALKQEASALSQQETLAKEALSAISNNTSGVVISTTDSNSTDAPQEDLVEQSSLTQRPAAGGGIESEVAELRERLHQAAEAYKTLYQQKTQAERKLQRIQELDKHSDSESKQ